MYEHREGCIYFILIDFDMATVLPIGDDASYVPTSKHRTGTLPFMAVDLIKDASMSSKKGHIPVAHRLCHDFESIFWLCLWCTLVMLSVGLEDSERNENLAIVRAWETAELKAIAFAKKCIRSEAFRSNQITLSPSAIEAGLDDWFESWTSLWRRVGALIGSHEDEVITAKRRKLPPPRFDFETVGGTLTRDNLKEVLTETFPEDPSILLPARVPEVQDISVASSTALRSQEATFKHGSSGPSKKAPAAKKTTRAKKTTKVVTTPATRKSRRIVKKSPGATEADFVKKAIAATAKKAQTRVTAKASSVKRSKTDGVAKTGTLSTPAMPQAGGDDENGWRKRLRPRAPKAY